MKTYFLKQLLTFFYQNTHIHQNNNIIDKTKFLQVKLAIMKNFIIKIPTAVMMDH